MTSSSGGILPEREPGGDALYYVMAVSYTHLTLPTKA